MMYRKTLIRNKKRGSVKSIKEYTVMAGSNKMMRNVNLPSPGLILSAAWETMIAESMVKRI